MVTQIALCGMTTCLLFGVTTMIAAVTEYISLQTRRFYLISHSAVLQMGQVSTMSQIPKAEIPIEMMHKEEIACHR